MGATRQLADFLAKLRYEDLTETAIGKAKLCLLDWTGVTVGAFIREKDKMDMIFDALKPFFGQPQAGVLTKKTKADLINTVLINGTASHLLDYDDVHNVSLKGHPSVPVVPSALAVGELYQIDGKTLLTAIVAGIEAECRVAEAVNPEHYDAGWHATATCGGFGACAASGKILGFNSDQMVTGFGVAGTQAFGIQQSFGTMCKPFHAGKAAGNGVLAAVLTKAGFTAPQEIVEGRNGFGKVYSPKYHEVNWSKLGQSFCIERVAYKRYSSCYGTHANIKTALGIRAKYKPNVDDIEKVVVKIGPREFSIAGKPEPRTALEGKFSNRYCTALALLKGEAVETDFTDELVNSPQIRKLLAKIDVRPEATPDIHETEIYIKMKNGTEINEKDNLQQEDTLPVAEWQPVLEAKALNLMADAYGKKRATDIIKVINTIESSKNIKALAELLA